LNRAGGILVGGIRKPQQTRSVETRKRIVEAGFRLLSEQGYYHITTADIAKAAGVSTGIFYRYFNNKLDIVNEIMMGISEEKILPLIHQLKGMVLNQDNLVVFLYRIIDEVCRFHEELGTLHDDMNVLFRDPKVIAVCGPWIENEIIKHIEQILVDSEFSITHATEKVHLAYQLIESYCHNKVLRDDAHLNFEVLREEVVRTLVFLIMGGM
jgi:AcrR family transcriptional regulator